MPFQPDEFYVGMIAYFTVNQLRRHPRIRTTNLTRDTKPRPFVCYAEGDNEAGERETYWTCLTTTWNRRRRTVSVRWLRCPPGAMWSTFGDLIVGDGRSSFAGPAEAFAECSHKYDRCNGMLRPWLTLEGVADVEQIVLMRGGLLPADDVAQAA